MIKKDKEYCCDIIIPVYNAYNELKECIDSLFTHTGGIRFRLIIINDKSPESEIEEYLQSLKAQKNPNLVILRNEQNLGFVKTVNLGMKYSSNDVVLLNSDTVLTSNWLKKIYDCAYSQENIATVTPLTNNGEICSVPNFCKDNELPEGFTVDSFAAFVERISIRQYPVVPTGVGFCMFIKRKVLNEIGIFDEVAFGKGYGEENDFCCRAVEHGYIHVIADNVFIYHKGEMSFKESKKRLIEKNLKILGDRYPYYHKNVHEFILRNPMESIHKNIFMLMDYYKFEAKNILYILHNDFEKPLNHPIGGTEFHVKDLLDNNNDIHIHTFVLISTRKRLILKRQISGQWEEYLFELNSSLEVNTFSNREYKEILERIILTFNINLIHIHHLMRHTFDCINIGNEYNIPVFITLHDYYLICPKVNLLDEEFNYCIDTRSDDKCRNCIKSSFGFDTYFLKKWREEVLKILPKFSRIIVPSASAKEIFEREYNLDNITVIEHGMNENKAEVIVRHKKIQDDTFNVAFIGGLAPNKGSGVIYNMILNNSESDIRWYLIGEIGDQRLNLMERNDVIKFGMYSRENIKEILQSNKIDMVCILSIWPETYSYTLSEAWIAGLPVVGSGLGAIKERIESTGAGVIVQDFDSKKILRRIYEYRKNVKEQEDINNAIRSITLKNMEQMINEYTELYNQAIVNTTIVSGKNNKVFGYNQIMQRRISQDDNGQAINIAYYQQIERDLSNIYGSLFWKVQVRVRKDFPWLLNLGKKILLFYLRRKKSYPHGKTY